MGIIWLEIAFDSAIASQYRKTITGKGIFLPNLRRFIHSDQHGVNLYEHQQMTNKSVI